jgi:acyl carrier protein
MPNESEVYTELTGIFHEVFLRDDIVLAPQMTAKDVDGWDSFKQIEILVSLEEKYGIKFRTKELDGLANVGDLVRTVLAKTGG